MPSDPINYRIGHSRASTKHGRERSRAFDRLRLPSGVPVPVGCANALDGRTSADEAIGDRATMKPRVFTNRENVPLMPSNANGPSGRPSRDDASAMRATIGSALRPENRGEAAPSPKEP